MLFTCKRSFETREGAFPRTIEEGGLWFLVGQDHPGGYEVAILERVEGGEWTGDKATVRASRLTSDFDIVPYVSNPRLKPGACKP